MAHYIYSPAHGPIPNPRYMRKCIQIIGAHQKGTGTPLSKGKRYLKKKTGCSGCSIKVEMWSYPKLRKHDFQRYGQQVLYYHKDACSKIVEAVIDYVDIHFSNKEKMDLFDQLPSREQLYSLIYSYRDWNLEWVVHADYYGQKEPASELYNRLGKLRNPIDNNTKN